METVQWTIIIIEGLVLGIIVYGSVKSEKEFQQQLRLKGTFLDEAPMSFEDVPPKPLKTRKSMAYKVAKRGGKNELTWRSRLPNILFRRTRQIFADGCQW